MNKEGQIWRWQDTRALQADRPLSTRAMLARLNNLRNVAMKRGSHHTVPFPATGYSHTNYTQCRPYTSLNRYSAFLLVPWLVNPGLSHIRLRLFARTGHGGKDTAPGDFTTASAMAGWTVKVRAYMTDNKGAARLNDDRGHADIASDDTDSDGTGSTIWSVEEGGSSTGYGFESTIDVGVNSTGLTYPVMDMLVVELMCAQDQTTAVGTDAESFTSALHGILVDLSDGVVGSKTFYDDDTAASSPQATSNWITCSEASNGTYTISSPEIYHEHVYAMSDQQMVLSPPLAMDAGAFGTTITLRYVPYLQVRTVEFEERYALDTLVTDGDTLWANPIISARDPDLASIRDVSPLGLGAMALDALAVYRRRELVCAGLWCVLDNNEATSNGWFSRQFGMPAYLHGKSMGSLTLTYADGGAGEDTTTRSAGSFITDGVTVGEQYKYTSGANNGVTAEVTAVTATVLNHPTASLSAGGPESATSTRAGSRSFASIGATRFATPKFHVLIGLIGAHVANVDSVTWRQFLNRHGLPSTLPAELDSFRIEGLADFTITISQAGTAVATQQSISEPIDYWPATVDDASRHLQAVKFAMDGDTAGAGLALRLGTYDYDLGDGPDAALMTSVTMEVPLDAGASFDPDLPCECVLRVDQREATIGAGIDAVNYPRWVPASGAYSSTVTMDLLRIDIPAFSVWASDDFV